MSPRIRNLQNRGQVAGREVGSGGVQRGGRDRGQGAGRGAATGQRGAAPGRRGADAPGRRGDAPGRRGLRRGCVPTRTRARLVRGLTPSRGGSRLVDISQISHWDFLEAGVLHSLATGNNNNANSEVSADNSQWVSELKERIQQQEERLEEQAKYLEDMRNQQELKQLKLFCHLHFEIRRLVKLSRKDQRSTPPLKSTEGLY